jgi:anti-anti-sigma factor
MSDFTEEHGAEDPGPVLTATLTAVGGAQLISVAGEVDLGTAEFLEARLDTALRAGGRIVVDLSGCGYIDSTGLTLMLRVHERARDRSGSELCIVAADGTHVRDMLRLTAMDQALSVYDDVDEALAASPEGG